MSAESKRSLPVLDIVLASFVVYLTYTEPLLTAIVFWTIAAAGLSFVRIFVI